MRFTYGRYFIGGRFSRRFGSSDKLLQLLPDGRSIALTSGENLIRAVPVSIAVVRTENKKLAESLLKAGLKVVFCSESDHQMADSLSRAVRFSSNFNASGDGFIIALADMPYIDPVTITAVASKLNAGASIVIPTYLGERGHPVGFSAKFRNELENLNGDVGARSIIKHYFNEAYMLPSDDAGILADIDTQADLRS